MTQPALTPALDYGVQPARPFLFGFGRSVFAWVFFAGLAIVLFLLLRSNGANYTGVSLSEFDRQLRLDNVQQVTIATDEVFGFFRTPVVLPIARGGGGAAPTRAFRTALPTGTAGN